MNRRPAAAIPPQALAAVTRALGVLTLALAGCAATPDGPEPVDSPLPQAQVEAGTPYCITHPAGPGVPRCLALVRAQAWHTATGVPVVAGRTYRIAVPPGQVWFDKGRPNTPLCGEQGNALMRMFNARRRNPGALWFSLQATVLAPADRPHLPRQELAQAPTDLCHAPGALQADFRPQVSGELALFPNDAVGFPGLREAFYGNNTGQVWVLISTVP